MKKYIVAFSQAAIKIDASSDEDALDQTLSIMEGDLDSKYSLIASIEDGKVIINFHLNTFE